MLREQILAVEVIRSLHLVLAQIAMPVAETEMDRVDMALPLVLGGKGGRTAVTLQRADERTGLGRRSGGRRLFGSIGLAWQ